MNAQRSIRAGISRSTLASLSFHQSIDCSLAGVSRETLELVEEVDSRFSKEVRWCGKLAAQSPTAEASKGIALFKVWCDKLASSGAGQTIQLPGYQKPLALRSFEFPDRLGYSSTSRRPNTN